MKAIIVDDEQLMLKKFERITGYFYDLMIVGKFESADDAIAFAEQARHPHIRASRSCQRSC